MEWTEKINIRVFNANPVDTMSGYRNVLLLLFSAALLLAPIVSAQQDNQNSTIIILPGDPDKAPVFSILAYDTIVQGETDYFTKYVQSGTSHLTLDLNWGTVSNSLSLTVNTPIGVYGPYYDSSDGRSDGRIVLLMSGAGQSLPSGTWDFRVYGDRVSGVEDYTFVAY
jgi:hypothetical protein